MNVLFVYPNIVESPKDFSVGLAILAALAKKQGHKTALIDTSFGMSHENIIQKAKNFKPDLIAITTATNDFKYATEISNILKQHINKPIIVGGYHPTIFPEEVISKGCFDFVCVGEGEGALTDLLKSLEENKSPDKIKNLWIRKKNGEIIKNQTRQLIQNLDELPFPDRELFDYKKYFDWNHGTATFISTRGCPYLCTYCINHFLIKKYKGKGKFLRFRSNDNLFKEIKGVLEKYGKVVKNLEFYDDTFTLDSERTEDFCKRYPKEIGIPFNLNARVNAVKAEDLRRLKQAGCVRISIGIESGDPQIRNKILKRFMTDEQIITTFLTAKKEGLKTYAFNMIGVPFETKEGIKKTILLNRACKPDYVGVAIFNAFKGTETYNLAKKNGWLKKDYATSYFRESNIQHPNFSISQLRRIRNSFGFNVFIRDRPMRAIVDLLDKNFSQIDSYILLRSKLIKRLNLLRRSTIREQTVE